jgi:hypothetical protein
MSLYFHSQNLTSDRESDIARRKPIYRAGRCWINLFFNEYENDRRKNAPLRAEWYVFYNKFQSLAFEVIVNEDDDDVPRNNIRLNIAVPWLFKLYLTIPTFFRIPLKPREFGVSYNFDMESVRVCFFRPIGENSSESASRTEKCCNRAVYIDMPWRLEHEKTEFLSHDLSEVVFTETKFDWETRTDLINRISRMYKYKYVLKNGTVQNRIATVYASKSTKKAKWYPFIPRKRVDAYIDVRFDDEVGERTGSWKGGAIGCEYSILKNETIEQCLRRMERERIFD